MSITIRDVAQAAGVSTATVSRALRGLPHVDPETRERVRRVAAELDYVVSPSASRLASGRTGTVAVITPFIDRWFFSTVLSGISDVLQESDVDLLVEFGPMDGYAKAVAYFDLLDELEQLLGVEVDLVMTGAVKNRYIARDIERTRQLLYAA